MAAPAAYDDPDDWELINDDGFVYKRKKRPLAASSSSAPPPPDPAAERKHRRDRKKRALLKLKDRYFQEITLWEFLSNTLREMERTAQTHLLDPQDTRATTSFGGASSPEERPASDFAPKRILDDLLSQVEAQEAIIRDVSNLCDVAEALCSAEEERLKQKLTDLPIWEPSPLELMASLGEQ